MSILIKGMDMPKTCAECRLCEGDTMDGLCHAVSKWFDDEYFRWYQYEEDDIDESKPANCPLVEVPPHGRLIDADAFEKKNAYFWGMDFINAKYEDCLCDLVNDAPTIIDAEVDE